VGAFSHKFSVVMGCKNGTDLYHYAKYRAPAEDEKVLCFFVCLSVCFFVTLWNDEVCDNGNAMKQSNFQNNYGVVA